MTARRLLFHLRLSSRRPLRHTLVGGVGLIAAFAIAACVLTSCYGSGKVTTSTGAVVSASVVGAQDDAADWLKILDDAYRAAVTAHDAWVATELPGVHAAHRKSLLVFHDSLGAAWQSLIGWKRASNDPSPPSILRAIVEPAKAFLPLAVELGILSQKVANAASAFLAGVK